MLKRLFICLLFLVFLVLGQSSVQAECREREGGWVDCTADTSPAEKRKFIDENTGYSIGAGVGCNPDFTSCYCCSCNGNCNGNGGTPSGNNCSQGQVWNDCASGTNTCIPGEKWNACKTGSNTLTNCRQERDSCPRYSAGNDCRDCVGGYEPNWWNNCQQSRQVPDTCYQGWNCYMVPNCQEVGGHWEERCWRADCWGVWVPDVICSGDRQQCDPYGAYPCTRTECTGGGWEQGACRQWGDWHQCFQGDPCYDSGSTHTVCDGKNDCKGGYSWDNCANNGVNSCRGGCVDLPCNSVAPSTPGLTSPVSGAEVSGTETNLAGATASWGTACSGQNYQFNIYVQQCDAIMNPTTLWKTVPASGNNFNELFAGVGGKGYCWTAEATNGVTTSAKATAQRWTFSSGLPWWQVSGGSVMTFGGVTSLVGQNQQFIKDAPGVVISGSGNVFLNGQEASANEWVVTDGNLSQKVSYRYDYDYVSGRIISTIKPAVGPNLAGSVDALKVGTPENGIYYVLVTGNLDITSNLDFGTSKVVVLVTGDANIKGKINFTKNVGLFALYAKGNINIDPSIGTVSGTGINPNGLPTHLEGLYLAQGAINTGAAASQLRLEGAFIGIGGVNLQRNLNSAWPSEYFVFRPDILINLPKQLLRQNHIWQELAP